MTNNKTNTNSRFEFTTKRPVAIIMIVLGIAVFGLVSYKTLSWDLMPEISYPSFTVRTEYPGAAPEEVENVVSRRLEEQLSLIKNLRNITSVSRPEQSDIILEFTWDANLDRAAQEIREKIGQVYLDRAVERPMILRYDPSQDPVLRIGIVSDKMPLMQLRQTVEEEIAREFESLEGVAAARVKGGLEKEILVKLDEKKLATTQIRFGEITTRLGQENINLAGGNIKEGDTEYIVRTLNEFKSVKEIGDIIIARKQNVIVRLKDIAEISYSHKERTVMTRVNQKESVEVDIYKEADVNIIEVCERVKKRLLGTPEQQAFAANLKKEKAEAKPGVKKDPDQLRLEKRMTNFLAARLSDDVKYNILSDQSIFISNSIDDVKNTAIIGGIFAVIILFLFLRSFGTTFIVAISIPLSIIATFAPLKFFGVSLNIMSLGGLALGIGMLVDNSIVVMESIFRCREEGDSFVDSAVRGVSEVGTAVIASTLTTIAVFFPIVFVEGIAGQIFGDLSMTVVFSLLASLMVSLFFIPMLASRKFENIKDPFSKRLYFPVEEKKSVKNFLLTPVYIIVNSAKLLFNLLLLSLLSLLCTLTVLLYFLLWLLRVNKPLIALIDKAMKNLLKRKCLWDDFMKILPFTMFVESMAKTKTWYGEFFTYFYLLIRYVFQGSMFWFFRVVMTFFAVFVKVIVKGIFIVLGGLFIPVIKFAAKLFNIVIDKVNHIYPRILAASLRNDVMVISIVLILFLASIFFIMPQLGSELIPEVHQGTLYVNVSMPVGTPVEKTDRRLQSISKKIAGLSLVTEVGYFAGTTKDELSEDEIGEHIGKITINIKKGSNIQEAENAVINDIRKLLVDYTDLDYNIDRPVLFSMKPPIEVVLKTYNLELLRKVSRDINDKMSELEGLKDIQSTVKAGFPELVVAFDRMRLAHYGMNAFDVASLIKNKIEGFVATKFKERDRRVDIRVYLKDDQRKKAEHIENLIINPGGAVP
ncbi:MAG: efflux RND transporter permease subunit, partial [bacterium]|nr:efflux RND transporter permease subunit [bacterium]